MLLVRLVSVPQKEVDLAADTLQEGIEKAAVILDELKDLALGIDREIARLLGMPNVPQTRRMACAIIANALVFHERVAGKYEGIKPLNLVCGPEVANPQAETLAAWAVVLKINYWPIFAIARDILGQLDSRPRPHRAHLPAAHRRPQIPRYLLHPPRVRRSAGPSGRGQAANSR